MNTATMVAEGHLSNVLKKRNAERARLQTRAVLAKDGNSTKSVHTQMGGAQRESEVRKAKQKAQHR